MSGMIKTFTVIGLFIVTLLFLVFLYAYEKISLNANSLIHYKPEISSVVLDRHGKKIAYIFKKQHRLYARYDEIPSRVVEALVAMEDTKFFEHQGINPDAILRAIVKDIKAGAFVEGGSTLTQQLIKNKLLSSDKKLARKFKEVILAMKIEQTLTKEEIIERYLNEISYSNNYFGIKTAANGYFRKPLERLTLKEIAMLIGIPNAPSFYNPLRYYERCLKKANSILFRMRSIGWISEEEYQRGVKEEPKVFKTSLTQNVAPFVVNELLKRFKGELGDIRTGGYEIYTTVDLEQQKIAKEAVSFGLKRLLEKVDEEINSTTLNGALVAVESHTGNILAMVGSESYEKSSFNRVTQAKRQPGSIFKPFIYQTALDMGYNPATPLTDLARSFAYTTKGKRKVWSPKNATKSFKGFLPLREALVHSSNLATINLVSDIGVSVIRRRLAHLDVEDIPRDMSIALGNLHITPLKMAQIFSVFANRGHMIEPRLVSRIVSKEGTVIYETRPKEIADFTTPEQAYMMTDILRDVIHRGTGKNAAVDGIELAGKTGTTNGYVDAWFCGYSPTIETVVWFGRDDNSPIAKRGASGGSVAAPVFAYFFEELLKLNPDLKRVFEVPSGVYMGAYEGKSELYTIESPFPRVEEETESEQEEHSYEEYTNGIGLANTIKIEEENPRVIKGSDLHPEQKAPERPASSDVGELF
jgi:penicillin-binding protein 1A